MRTQLEFRFLLASNYHAIIQTYNIQLQMVQQMRKLAQFLLGDFEAALSPTGDGFQRNSQRLRQLLPVIREYAPQLRQFGTLLGVRLSEKALSRGLNWASSRLVTR